jgi:hypothetical protein
MVCLMVFSLCSPVVTKFLRRVPGNAGPGEEPSQVYGNALYAP